MNYEDFRKNAHQLVDWMADYLENKENYPVTPDVQPGDIFKQIPDLAPEESEEFGRIFRDFEQVILPGMSHWQHPSFFGYFPANNSAPSILAEMLMSGLGAQCMSWLTSPAATELEEKVLDWLREEKGFGPGWKGVIQDTASSATLCALMAAREKASDFEVNQKGFPDGMRFRIYCSEQAHSSVDKAVRILGLGENNLVKIAVDKSYAMEPKALKRAIEADLSKGFRPICVVSSVGTTSSVAIDPVNEVGKICNAFQLWHHIDAAFAGTALLLPEFRWMVQGLEFADSYVFNPHKWMFTNFDCSVLFVKDTDHWVRTFSLTPEYLRTTQDEHVNNYRDWGIQLGRRFRALKLWFVIRSYGLAGIRSKIREHIDLAKEAQDWIEEHPDLEVLVPNVLNTICFRYVGKSLSLEELNELNSNWMASVNASGKAFFTHTKLGGRYCIRWVIGQTDVERQSVAAAWQLLMEKLEEISKQI